MNFSKKIICCFILMILYFKSYGQLNKTKLTDYVIQELNITINEDYSHTNESIIPYDKNHSIILIANPVVFKDGKQYIEYDSHIVVINNKSKKIKHRFFESHKTNGWISDAVPIERFDFDFSVPPLGNKIKPYGIVIKHAKPSGATQYFGNDLTLLVPEKDTLKAVLKNYTISYQASLIGGNCNGETKSVIKELILAKERTHGLYDIIIKIDVIEIIRSGVNSEGDCEIKSRRKAKQRKVLKFNGKIYPFEI